jgi:hypothetical protein
MGQSAERKRADRAEAAGPYPKPRGKAPAAGCPRFPTTTLRSASQMLLLALRRTSATVCAGAYRWATSGLRRRCRRSHGSQSAQSSPLGSVPAWVWGEVRSVPPPSSSDGGGTGRSSSGRRRLGGDSTAGGASALQTVRHDHLKPQTRVPIPPSLDTRTDICLSHSQVARHSPLTPPTSMALGCRVTAAARPAITPTTQAVRRASAAPMCDGASGVCTCVSVHVTRAPQGGRAVVPAAAAGGSALAGGWTCVRVCRAAVAAHRVAARGGQTLAATSDARD